MRALFTGWPVEIVSQASLGICSPPETALTFVENALLKARHASRSSGLPAIADDSGIEVDALGGAPGIYSAHYAGEGATDAANVELLLEHVGEVPDEERTARFRAVVVFLQSATDPTPQIFTGTWEGRLLKTPRGQNGFGYDPVFLVPSIGLSAAELDATTKNRLSHRAQALLALRDAFPSGF